MANRKMDSITTGKTNSEADVPVVETIRPSKNNAGMESTLPTQAESTSPEMATPDTFDKLFPEPSIIIGDPPKWIWWLLLLVASGITGIVGYRLATSRLNAWLSVTPTPSPSPQAVASSTPSASTSPTSTPILTPTPTIPTSPTPSSTPTPTATPLPKSGITMRILNGTTTAGAAAIAETTLTKAGFTVRTIGNAKQQNYDQTIIYYLSGHLAEAQEVGAALTNRTPTYEESSLADPDMVLVVLGTH